jgi:cell division protein FtsQ
LAISLRRWVVLTGVVAAGWGVSQLPALQRGLDELAPVERLTVRGNLRHTDREQLGESLAVTLDGGFFTANLAALRRRAEAEPWVRRAWVQRHWPATIEVAVAEHRALAVYRGPEGPPRLLDRSGRLFKPVAPGEAAGLPMLAGPKGRLEALMDRLRGLREALPQVRVAVLAVDARGAWTAELAKRVTVHFGREQWRARLQRLARVNGRWGLVRPGVKRIDLRYPSGMAVALAGAQAGEVTDPQTHTGAR